MIIVFRRDDFGAKTASLRAKSRANIKNLIEASCKQLSALGETRDIITPALQQEESVRSALKVQAMIRSRGLEGAARVYFVRHLQTRGDNKAITECPQAIEELGRARTSRSCSRKEGRVSEQPQD